jgi:hypothetical protein
MRAVNRTKSFTHTAVLAVAVLHAIEGCSCQGMDSLSAPASVHSAVALNMCVLQVPCFNMLLLLYVAVQAT